MKLDSPDRGLQTDAMARKPEHEASTVVGSRWRARVSAVSPVALPSGRFLIDGQIGHGGRSVVYMIHDKTLLRHSAMKVLAARTGPSEEDRQRFIEEAQITGQLDHPNVVPIHELSVTERGTEVELRRLGPGEVFGETAILLRAPRTASVQALETLVLQVVSPEELEDGVGVHTGLGLLVRTLAARFREHDERLTELEAELAMRR
jgi:CRP-like cAMP-binding protein